ncbi:MAG: HAMP domain-containing sensor histidine kinase [Coriobacteriales bacterium]|nr:HAMP domain-containing sensor histidine kinase [Coriobacteriales bacterium]
MDAQAISALRRKFVAIAMLSFLVVISFTGGMMAFANEHALRAHAGKTLEVIINNDGVMPEFSESKDSSSAVGSNAAQTDGNHAGGAGSSASQEADDKDDDDIDAITGLSREFTYGARYFSVVFGEDYVVKTANISRIASVTEIEAIEYALEAIKSYENPTVSLLDLGTKDSYYYRVRVNEAGETIVAFLDCSFQKQVNKETGLNTVLICVLGMAGSFLVVLLLSNRAIRPEIENSRKQKQFITNASHELKTPLAVIRANTEVLEMLQGENEWTHSTMSQVDRMDGLVQNLVMIARSEEREDRAEVSEVDVARVVADTVDPFQALARQEHLELVCVLEENVHMVASESSIQQLTTLLVDNAIKYCDQGGEVTVTLTQPKRGKVTLSVSNSFAEGEKAQFNRFFERFYRDDEAHSNGGGYGIGLSVAESICKRYRGTIRASWKAGVVTFMCQLRSE